MVDRLEVGAYFVTQKKTFCGKMDEWADITVCGTTYVGYGGMKRCFVDRDGDENQIEDVLVDLQDFAQLSRAFARNEVELSQGVSDEIEELVRVTESY